MNSPFADLSRVQTLKLYEILDTHVYKYNKNEDVLPIIKNSNIIAIILKGSVQISYIEYNGNEVILENLATNDVFGTNISSTDNDNCDIIAKEDTEVLVIDYVKLMNPRNLRYPYFNTFFRNLFDIINAKFKEKNERMRILEKKQIRERLLAYFDIQRRKSGSRYVYLPFALKDLADYISVNRSAMFRELKHMKEEKLIEIKDKRITLYYQF